MNSELPNAAHSMKLKLRAETHSNYKEDSKSTRRSRKFSRAVLVGSAHGPNTLQVTRNAQASIEYHGRQLQKAAK